MLNHIAGRIANSGRTALPVKAIHQMSKDNNPEEFIEFFKNWGPDINIIYVAEPGEMRRDLAIPLFEPGIYWDLEDFHSRAIFRRKNDIEPIEEKTKIYENYDPDALNILWTRGDLATDPGVLWMVHDMFHTIIERKLWDALSHADSYFYEAVQQDYEHKNPHSSRKFSPKILHVLYPMLPAEFRTKTPRMDPDDVKDDSEANLLIPAIYHPDFLKKCPKLIPTNLYDNYEVTSDPDACWRLKTPGKAPNLQKMWKKLWTELKRILTETLRTCVGQIWVIY